MGRKGQSKYENKIKIGDKFGKWEVIDDKIYITTEAKIKCRCDCGGEHLVSAFTLFKGTSTQCLICGNSLQMENNPAWKGYKEIPYGWFSKYFKRGNKKNHRTEDITIQQIYDIWIKQNKKCTLSNVDIDFIKRNVVGISASIDRIDSKKEYTIDNVQLVHKDVNLMKNKYDQNYFLKMCKLIVNHCEVK